MYPVRWTVQNALHFTPWQTCPFRHQLDFSGDSNPGSLSIGGPAFCRAPLQASSMHRRSMYHQFLHSAALHYKPVQCTGGPCTTSSFIMLTFCRRLRQLLLLHHFCDVTENLGHSFLTQHLKGNIILDHVYRRQQFIRIAKQMVNDRH